MMKEPGRFLPGWLSSSARNGKRNDKDHDHSKPNDTAGSTGGTSNVHGKKAVLRLPYSSSSTSASPPHHRPSSKPQKLSATLAQIHRQQLIHEQHPQQQQLSHNAAHALYTGRRQDYINHHHQNDDDDDDSTSSNLPNVGYALEFDCGESVSSLNDSCFGGASVTGGYNIYSSTANSAGQQPPPQSSPMKQATSLAVGVVPSISVLSVSDHPSFDTEDISYFVHDVEQPPIVSPLPPHTHTNNSNEVEENSLINAKNGRLRTMMPILTGTLSPKQKRSRWMTGSHPPPNSDRTGRNGNHHPTVRSSSVVLTQPQKEHTATAASSTKSWMISTTSSEQSHHEHPIMERTIPPNTTTTSTNTMMTTTTHHKERCYPSWLQRVPLWLKVLLCIGWMLLLLAIVTAIIGGIVSSVHNNNNNKNQSSASLYDNNHPLVNDTIDPKASNVFFVPPNATTTVTPIVTTIPPTMSPTIRHPKQEGQHQSSLMV